MVTVNASCNVQQIWRFESLRILENQLVHIFRKPLHEYSVFCFHKRFDIQYSVFTEDLRETFINMHTIHCFYTGRERF